MSFKTNFYPRQNHKEVLGVELNFNIADMFRAMNEFMEIARALHKKTRDDEFEENRFSCCMEVIKKDIKKLMNEIGDGS